ncbi:FMN adenylyltransferase [Sporobolomyces koalae]|uniref:FMN adenylyltransferase n=1 Tax=Sporobolomyces koalae TaxID=500713 RepID=UPI0031706AFE
MTPRARSPSPPPRAFVRPDSDAVYELSRTDSPLGHQVRSALDVIERALDLYSIDHLALSFNGGKDCTVLVHLLAAALLHRDPSLSHLPPISTIYVRQSSPFPEEEAFTSLSARRYHLDLAAIDQDHDMRHSLDYWLKQRIQHGLHEVRAVLVGTRRTDPHGAKLSAFDRTDPSWPQFMRVHPILDWSYAHIWQFLRHPLLTLGGTTTSRNNNRNVEWCELYDRGYTSIGSIDTTKPNPCLERTRVPNQSSSSSIEKTTSNTTTPGRGTETDEQVYYLPAWELEDETKERAGRYSRSNLVPPEPLQEETTLKNS